MALASATDVELALGRDLTEAEEATAASSLDEASDLVLGYLLWSEVPDEIPEAVVRVVASIVATALTAPQLPQYPPDTQANAGQFGIRLGDSSRVYLTNALRLRLRPYRRAFNSIQFQSDRY